MRISCYHAKEHGNGTHQRLFTKQNKSMEQGLAASVNG